MKTAIATMPPYDDSVWVAPTENRRNNRGLSEISAGNNVGGVTEPMRPGGA